MSPARRRPRDDASSFINFEEAANMADPAVSALLTQSERRRSEARLAPKEREKKRKERDKIRARRPYHTTYDIPVELRQKIRDLAERHGVPASQIATLGLLRFVEDVSGRQVDIDFYKAPSRSPRYEYNLVLEMQDFPATFEAPRRRGR